MLLHPSEPLVTGILDEFKPSKTNQQINQSRIKIIVCSNEKLVDQFIIQHSNQIDGHEANSLINIFYNL